MITRADYMENSSDLHQEYHAQFVTPQTIYFVNSEIGLKRLQASECKHLNDVVRWEHGCRTWLWDRTPMNDELVKKAGDNFSSSTRTCVGKAAARMILEDAKNAKV